MQAHPPPTSTRAERTSDDDDDDELLSQRDESEHILSLEEDTLGDAHRGEFRFSLGNFGHDGVRPVSPPAPPAMEGTPNDRTKSDGRPNRLRISSPATNHHHHHRLSSPRDTSRHDPSDADGECLEEDNSFVGSRRMLSTSNVQSGSLFDVGKQHLLHQNLGSSFGISPRGLKYQTQNNNDPCEISNTFVERKKHLEEHNQRLSIVHTRAAERRISMLCEKEQQLLIGEQRRRKAEELRKSMAQEGTHRRVRLWSELVLVERALSIMREQMLESIRRHKAAQMAMPLIGMKARRWLRRARSRIAARSASKPTIPQLRFDKMLNLFSDAHLQHLINSLELRYYFLNETIIFMGSEDDEGYVLHQGTADVMMGPVKVFTLKAGMSFGTVGMISGEPRTASIVAREPCLVWYITRKKFEAFQSADGQVAAALQIVAELRQTNMRNVYKSSLSISFLRTFGSLLGVESEMIQSFIEASAPLVAKTGATLCASSRKSRRLFSMSRVAGAAALSLQQQQLLQPMYLLRGTVRIILEEPVNASGMSYEEQAAYLADLPLPPKLLAQQKATSDISSIVPEQRLIVQCGSRSELEAKLNVCINTSSFGADVSTSLLSLGGGGNDDGEGRKGSVVTGSRSSDMCHWVDVHGPAFINLANQFLTDISFGHFEIVALSPCDLFTLKREHLINQDVLELAVLRNNCAQIHCRFIPTLSKPTLQRVFLRSIHEVPTKEYFNGITAIHDVEGVEQFRGVFSKNDVISFGGPRDDPNAVYIIVSGELEHVDGRSSSATKPPLTGGGGGATPKANHTKFKSSSGGVPSLQQCFIWPDLPVVYFGCLPATAKAVTRVDVIRIRRSDVIRVLAASCDENALGQLTNLLASAFTSKFAKQPTFVEPLSLAVRRGSRTSRGGGGGADGGTSSSNRCDDAAAERGALKRVQSIRIATQRFAKTHVPLSLDAEREEAIASGAVTQVLRDTRRPPTSTDGHVASPNRKTSSNVFEDVPIVADPVNTNNEPTAGATGHQQQRGVPGLPRAPLPSPHQNAIQVLQQPQRTTHPSDTHPATTPAAPSSMTTSGAKPRGSSNTSSSLVTGSFGAMFVVPGSVSRDSSFDRASPSCGRLVLDEALPFSYSYESQVPTPKRTPANEFLRSRIAGAAGSSSSAQHLAKRTSSLRTSNPLHSGESSGQFDADVDSNNGWQSSGSLKNSCEVSLSSVRSITLQPPSSNHAKAGRHQRHLGKGRAGGGVDCEQDDDEDDSTVDQARLASLLDVLRHEHRDHDSSVSHGSGSSRDASPARGYSSGGGGSAVVYQPVVHRMVIQRRPTTSGGKGASPVIAPQHATTARSSTPLIPSGDQNINDRRNRPPPPPASGSSSARTGTTPHASPTSANPRWRQYEHQQKNQSSTSSLHSSLSSPVTRSGGRGDSAPSSSPATSHSVQNERTKLLARASRQLAKRKELLQ